MPHDADDPRDLVLTRLISAPRRALWRAWTEPDLLKQWFAPKPWTTPVAELDVRPGGTSLVVMRSPEGQDMANPGVYLEVVPDVRLVVTDAYRSAWIPSDKPFLTVILTFAEEAGGTRYTARARHWTLEDRAAHEAMGFETGWGQCADQLTELVTTLG